MSDADCVKVLANLAAADPVGVDLYMQMFMAARGEEHRLSEWQMLFRRGGWLLEE